MKRAPFIVFLHVWYVIAELVTGDVLYEEVLSPSLHPRTFYLSPGQEYQMISQILCEGSPCPEFSVIQDYAYFIQRRSYREAKFLRLTTSRTCDFKLIMDDGLNRLHNFIQGANNRQQNYTITLPLLIEVDQHLSSKSKNPWCLMSYRINFFIPHYWGSMATPTEMLPEFFEIPENFQVYVHTFNGEIDQVLFREIEFFRRNLDTLTICYKKMKFYIAIYDIPHSPADSRNEMWFIKCTER
ncbi:uncharacterized protein LOC129218703 [Uloborus diversus]|uniref:uncharacterized protein LOC129218703 n=1 Tax=Uloborus diversus TaxID=327109 RepID=UPI00240A4712|nr:uncharacterized protein LOC129218703 [Uloborus diversus]